MKNTYSSKQIFGKLTYLHWLFHQEKRNGVRSHDSIKHTEKGQGRVLTLLKRIPEISTADLAYLLDIRQQSLNELLIKLEKSGYIVRDRSEEDKRVLLVKITEKGKSIEQEDFDYSVLFSCFSQEDQDIFGDYLTRLIDELEKRLRAKGERLPNWMENDWSDMTDQEFLRMMHEHIGKFHHHGIHNHRNHEEHARHSYNEHDHHNHDRHGRCLDRQHHRRSDD